METVIEVRFHWGEDVDPTSLGQEELEDAIHEAAVNAVWEPCNVHTEIKRWE